MKKKDIKSHLAPYLICKKRRTTINHAFASAIAPHDLYEESRLDEALRLLGQDPDSLLYCVYCDLQADTWDHLVGLVKNEELHGYGHQIGNLVPCCSSCNSKKGAKEWNVYLREVVKEQTAFETKCKLIDSYRDRYAVPVNLQRTEEKCPEDWKRYHEIKDEIFKLMGEADTIANRLRSMVASEDS